jgi:hypothetical protein
MYTNNILTKSGKHYYRKLAHQDSDLFTKVHGEFYLGKFQVEKEEIFPSEATEPLEN